MNKIADGNKNTCVTEKAMQTVGAKYSGCILVLRHTRKVNLMQDNYSYNIFASVMRKIQDKKLSLRDVEKVLTKKSICTMFSIQIFSKGFL